MVFSYLQDHTLTSKLFKEVAPRFKSRKGGYTRILHLQRRKGDGADLALLELTEKEIKIKETKPKPKKEHSHDGHDHHKPGTAEAPAKGGSASGGKAPEKSAHPKQEPKKEQPKSGFFKNVSKFFRNKGGS